MPLPTTQEFLDSLPEDLNPEERATQISEFAIKKEAEKNEDYKTLQSASQKGVDTLAEKIVTETKKVDSDPSYIHELFKNDPKTAEAYVKQLGSDYTVEDLRAGKPLPPKDDNFDKKMSEYESKKENTRMIEEFKSAVAFSPEELKQFESKMEALIGGRSVGKEELKNAMVGVAFSMGKQFSNNKDAIVANHNAVPTGGTQAKSGEYSHTDPGTSSFLKEHGVISSKPED